MSKEKAQRNAALRRRLGRSRSEKMAALRSRRAARGPPQAKAEEEEALRFVEEPEPLQRSAALRLTAARFRKKGHRRGARYRKAESKELKGGPGEHAGGGVNKGLPGPPIIRFNLKRILRHRIAPNSCVKSKV